MNSPEKINSLGFVQKKETLASVKTPVDHNELILEAVDPYPGYYSPQHIPNWSKGPKTKSLYFIIKPFDCCNEERITKIAGEIRENIEHSFEARPGQLSLMNKECPCIRVRINSTFIIPELVERFQNGGISFLKKKKIEETESMIKVQKFFNMLREDVAIYHDRDNSNIYYLQLHKPVDWETFEAGTVRLKSSLQYPDFDAALANIYYQEGFLDFIRIYAPHLTIYDMEQIREKYLKTL